MKKALVVIDIQNDITKHYRDIIEKLNAAVEWAVENGLEVIYIKHNNLSAGTRTFKPGTKGEEFVPELEIVSDHIFVKTKASALTSEAFAEFIRDHDNGVTNFHFEIGADLLNDEELDLLGKLRPGLVQLEIGVQSTNPDVLDAIGRKDISVLADLPLFHPDGTPM